MTETNDTPPADNVGDLRGKLLRRLAVASGLVALLLGVLAFFDYLSSVPDEVEEPRFTKPVPVAPKKEVSQPVTPTDNLPEPPAVEQKAPEPEPAKPSEPPPAPAPAAEPATSEIRQPSQSTAAVQKTPPVAPKTPVRTPAGQPVPEATTAPSNMMPPPLAGEATAHPQREIRPAPATPPQPVVPPSAPRLFPGFLLQAGVFSSPQRAEELHARLTLSGVPSTLETRVQVGPFRTRQEAEAAQVKLRELGINTVLVPPRPTR